MFNTVSRLAEGAVSEPQLKANMVGPALLLRRGALQRTGEHHAQQLGLLTPWWVHLNRSARAGI